jgi:flagellar hook-basal body complex protein FliE
MGNFMISNTQNHLLGQMQALEALAKSQDVRDTKQPSQEANFGELMQQAINQVNETQMQASSLTRAFELGENVDLSQVMIAVQKSRVSFEALTQVRNKLLTAYQDVMNMSV